MVMLVGVVVVFVGVVSRGVRGRVGAAVVVVAVIVVVVDILNGG